MLFFVATVVLVTAWCEATAEGPPNKDGTYHPTTFIYFLQIIGMILFSCQYRHWQRSCKLASRLVCKALVGSAILGVLVCGLTTLETRRLRGDQIEVFKIMNGHEDIDRNMFFKLKEGSRTRGHKAALVKEQCRLDMRNYSFSQRVINEWNKLPNDRVNASSVNLFTNRIDRYLIRAGYT